MRSDIAVAAILLALAGYIFLAASALPFGTARVPQTAFFPKTLAVLLAILSLVVLAQALAGKKATFDADKIGSAGWFRIGASLATLIGFALVLQPLGLLLSTFLRMVCLLRAIEAQSWGKVIAVALATSLLTYGLFAWLLGVPLPAGVLGI
jgi:putative tricarboxylic transport membrane protein